MRAPGWIACFLIAACGSGSPSSGAASKTEALAPPASDYPCWPVAPMRLVVPRRGGEWEPIVEMQGDGAIYRYKDGARKFVARVKNDALLDAHDVPSLTCIHREIAVPGAAAKAQYDEKDTFFDSRVHITVADDGAVTMSGAPGVDVRIEGPITKTRRTAVLLVLAALMGPWRF